LLNLYEYRDSLISGALVTIEVAVLSVLIALVLGLAGAFMKLSKSPIARQVAMVYTTLVRGVPDLVLMLLIFFGGQVVLNWLAIDVFGGEYIDVSPFVAGVLTIGFIYGAYFTETFRGAMLAVPQGQVEAAEAYGMSRTQVFLNVLGPQMIRHALPGINNNWLVLMKTTALVSVIGLADVVRNADLAGKSVREPFIFFLAVAVIYLLFTTATSPALQALEKLQIKPFHLLSRLFHYDLTIRTESFTKSIRRILLIGIFFVGLNVLLDIGLALISTEVEFDLGQSLYSNTFNILIFKSLLGLALIIATIYLVQLLSDKGLLTLKWALRILAFALLAFMVLGFLYFLIFSFDWALVGETFPLYVKGLWLTLALVSASLVIGLVLSLPLAVGRTSSNPLINGPIYVYTYFFRGTPLLVQLYLIYYGLSQSQWIRESFLWNFIDDAWKCAMIAFVLNTTAYTTEIIRGAIQRTPQGEVEAARAAGMSQRQVYTRILLPSALRRALPTYGNEVIFMLHGSAIVSIITVEDLLGVARIVNSRYYTPYEAFLTVGAFYLVLTFGIVYLFRELEKRYLRHLRRDDAPVQKVKAVPAPA